MRLNKYIVCTSSDTFNFYSALEEAIPNLHAFMDGDISIISNDECSSGIITDNLNQQLKFLLAKLVCAIAQKSHPIVILFEDLHWSDKDALDTVRNIMTDRNTLYCLYFLSFRDNNAAIFDVTRMIEAVQARGLQLFNIRLGAIDKGAVNSLVSETLVGAILFMLFGVVGRMYCLPFIHANSTDHAS